ncbi:hypothetical protein MAR_021099 [Mya arenaria]|uniref:Integrase zinc-binding domain-containing protein n=1 Tax=Mya arenaria TaxID=6604 RepID=A0ABY7E788_MYAAR|nr:hypothetical protein MAR_021099 [Mya arenaria]
MYEADTLSRAHLNDINRGWPNHIKRIHACLKPYWNIKDKIHISDEMLFFNERIIIPLEMRRDIRIKLHESHLQISKTKARASGFVYWPRTKSVIEEKCSKCTICNMYKRRKTKEALPQDKLTLRPWQTARIAEIVADNMLFNSELFKTFCEKLSIKLTTTSPTYSQNETVTLLEYRNTQPTGNDYSNAQIFMSKRLRVKVPTKSDRLKPKVCAMPANSC